METLKTITGQLDIGELSHVGDAGVAVALIILLIVVALALLKLGLEWLKTRQKLAGLEHEREMKRINVEADQTAVLDQMRKDLDGQKEQRDADRAVTGSLLSAIKQLTTSIDRLNASQADAAQRMADVTQQREEKLEAMHGDIRDVAGAVQAGLEPQLERLRKTIQDGFKAVEDSIMQRVEQLGEGVTPSLRATLKQEIEAYSRQTARQLENLTGLVEALNPEARIAEKQGQQEGKNHGQHATD